MDPTGRRSGDGEHFNHADEQLCCPGSSVPASHCVTSAWSNTRQWATIASPPAEQCSRSCLLSVACAAWHHCASVRLQAHASTNLPHSFPAACDPEVAKKLTQELEQAAAAASKVRTIALCQCPELAAASAWQLMVAACSPDVASHLHAEHTRQFPGCSHLIAVMGMHGE
jgi:hypothetical protein